MTTSEAVLELRTRVNLSREDFAQRLGVSSRTIYRFENGQQPTTKALLALADMSDEAGLKSFADLFRATRHTNINARVKRVSASSRSRRVAFDELAHWAVRVEEIAQNCKRAFNATRDESIGLAWSYAEALLEDIKLYIAGADKPGEISWERLQKIETALDRARKGEKHYAKKTK